MAGGKNHLRRLWLESIVIAASALLLRLWRLGEPRELVFDEYYYAPAAYSYIQNLTDPNWVQPPLGKELIALGIMLLGYNSLGWRLMCAVAGGLTIVLVYWLGWLVFRSRFIAFASAFMLTFEPLHFIHSRTALLDIFLTLFIVAGFTVYVKYLRSEGLRWLLLSSLMFSLAVAVKWPALACIVAAIIIPLAGGSRRRLWRHIIIFLLLPPVVYLLSYTPLFIGGMTLDYWWLLHREALMFHMFHLANATHPYASPPWMWLLPFQTLPYYLDASGAEITATLNPIILWIGVPSAVILLVNAFGWNPVVLSIPAGFLILYLPWFLSPRMTFLYYMLPTQPFLVVSAAWLIEALWIDGRLYRAIALLALASIVGVFVIYYPSLTAL